MPKNRLDDSGMAGRSWRETAQDRLRCGLLLDFYGELLTPRQRECCELHYNEDLSLSEIAETCGISRQGAWDNIRRGTSALEEIEAKTGLFRRSAETTEHLKTLEELLRRIGQHCGGNDEVAALLRKAQEELGVLLKTED